MSRTVDHGSTAPPGLFLAGSPCPCGCGATGSKLSHATGHISRGCACFSCRGKRNRKKGRAAQTRMHQALGGTGVSPANEETARGYEIKVFSESKNGSQVPIAFSTFIHTDWFRRALDQAERANPIGGEFRSAVYVEPAGGGQWLIVKL